MGIRWGVWGCGWEGVAVGAGLNLVIDQERMVMTQGGTCEHATCQIARHAQVNRATKSFGHLLAKFESKSI